MTCNSCKTHTKDKNSASSPCAKSGTCSHKGFGTALHSYNFLSHLPQATGQEEKLLVEVHFKNDRKVFFYNAFRLPLQAGQLVCVEGELMGYDIGTVSLTGILAEIQMQKKDIRSDQKFPKILRFVNQNEIDIWQQAQKQEQELLIKSREIIWDLNLQMKLSDVEFQADQSSAIFYYIAQERVDFRQLIKILGSTFKIRIIMRQIGARQEAAKIGGIGSCGRELCCSTWLTDFRTVNTHAARYQQLSINPQKLTGQCGKLKCCLNYELDMYMEAFSDLPPAQEKLKFKEGNAVFFKADIFKKTLFYSLLSLESGQFITLEIHKAKEIIALNEKGIYPALDTIKTMPAATADQPRIQNRSTLLKKKIEASQQDREKIQEKRKSQGKRYKPKDKNKKSS